MKDEPRKRVKGIQKRRKLVNGIIKFLTPTIKDMRLWEIRGLLSEIQSTIELKFHPFGTFGQAIKHRRGK